MSQAIELAHVETAEDGSPRVQWEIRDRVGYIRFVREDARNALDPAFAEAFTRAVDAVLDSGEVRAVLVSAAGPSFCVGGDIRYFAAMPETGAAIRGLAEAMGVPLNRLIDASVPVVAAVHGAIAGAGVGMACSAHITLAAESASFTSAYSAIGFAPDCGTSWFLRTRLGSAKALDLMLTNRRLDAQTAVSDGLISRVVADDALEAEAEKLVRTLANGPAQAHAEIIRLSKAAGSRSVAEHMDDEAGVMGRLPDTADGRAGVAGFLSKTRPVFG